MKTKRHGPSVTRDVAPLSLRASVTPGSLDEEARTVEIVWTTGARVLRGFFEQFYEELSLDPKHVRMERLHSGAPLLDSHQSYDLGSVIGVVESARLEKDRGVAVVRFARDERGSAVFEKVRDGIVRNVSVGYRVHRFEKVEGGDEKIPVLRATDWEPYEISMVPMGADAGAGVRSQGAATNPCEFILEERSMSKTKTSPKTTAADRVREAATAEADAADERAEDENEDEDMADAAAGGEGESAEGEGGDAAAEGDEDEDKDREGEGERALRVRAALDERARIKGIHRVARALSLPGDFADKHIEAGTTLDQFRAEAQTMHEKHAKIETGRGPHIEAGADARDKWLRGAGDWLLARATVDRLVVDAARKSGDTVKIDPGEFRGATFVDLARQALERAGVSTRGMDKMTLLGRALTLREGGAMGTSDFATLLENVMHKTLQAAYALAPDTWSKFCAVGSVSDFRPHPRYRLGNFGRLSQVNEAGEFTNQALDDAEKESISAVTKGNIIALTRQALINDDMGAFSRMATMIGRAARLSIEADVYDLIKQNSGLGPTMSDGVTLFHASHSNIGADSTIGVDALDADRVIMAQQMDPSGNDFLDLRPAILLVPIGLGGQARVINDAQYDVDSGSVQGTPNKVRGLFRDIVDSPRLTGTRRYLIADPQVAPTFEVVFLDGQQSPFLEVRDGWRTDGVEWKVRLDYGVGAVDYRGAVTNDGTP